MNFITKELPKFQFTCLICQSFLKPTKFDWHLKEFHFFPNDHKIIVSCEGISKTVLIRIQPSNDLFCTVWPFFPDDKI